ncbi:MAG: YraN family protein [Planctomycetes bacterium]|nr:YraN family protein [Planctomycetota bacterium]
MSSDKLLSVGKLGENHVCQQLCDAGWQILQRNYRCPFAELDIVAKDSDGNLVIVEVKTRSSFSWLNDYDCVGQKQMRRLAKACVYLGEINYSKQPPRLDLAIVRCNARQIDTWHLISDLELIY